MAAALTATPLCILGHPYTARDRLPVTGGKKQLREDGRHPGSALIWHLRSGPRPQDLEVVRHRPGGLPLIVVLPENAEALADPRFLHMLESVRPLGILPFQQEPALEHLVAVLRQPPEDLAAEVTDYLVWRGIPLGRETARLIRRTLALSAELRSISALSRSLYLSRRALGRRFLDQGLPVPSHWLQFGRLLRVAVRLQNSEESVVSIGYELGYPDGFSLSNQMVRLTGYRPIEVRRFLGWEWLLEGWMRREADTGGLAPALTQEFLSDPAPRRRPPRSLESIHRMPDTRERKAAG